MRDRWWKSSLVKAKKKGKTVGRPSNAEKLLSVVLSNMMKKNEVELLKVMKDQMFYGTGCAEFTNDGKILHKKFKKMKSQKPIRR